LSRRRIILVSSKFHPLIGGAERQGLLLARSLRRRGHPVVVVTMAHRPIPGHLPWLFVPGSSLAPVPILRIAHPRVRKLGPAIAYLRGMDAIRRLARGRDTVVQIQSFDQFAVPLALAALALRVPFLVRITGAYEMSEGYLSAARGLRVPLARFVLRRAGRVIALNPAIAARLREIGVREERILGLPNAIPDGLFEVERVEGPRRRLLGGSSVLFLGRLERYKGVVDLIGAWKTVAASHPGATLHVVGEGSQRPRLEAELDRDGLRRSVVLWGFRTEPEAFFPEADAFVLPSLEEGMPNTLLEAMAAGLPCAASDIPGTRGIVRDGRTGLLFPPGEGRALAAVLDRLLGSESLRSDLGRAARESVRGQAASVIVERYLELYGRMAARNGSS